MHGDLPFLGDGRIEIDHVLEQIAHIHRAPVERHGAGLRFGHIHQGAQHREHPLRFLEAVSERLLADLEIDPGSLLLAERRRQDERFFGKTA